MVLDWYSLLSSCLPIFPRERSLSSSKDLKKHLFIYFPRGLRHEESLVDHYFSCIRYVSVDNLIQPSDEPFLSPEETKVEILRAEQSLRCRGYINQDEYKRERQGMEDIGWRGLGYSVFLSHKETGAPPRNEIFKMLQHHTWSPPELQCVDMACINVEQKLYFFGGYLEKDFECNRREREFSKEVHSYDLLNEGGGHYRCADMLESGSGCRLASYGDTPPLVVHIDGKIYVLYYFKKKSSDDDDSEEAICRAYRLYAKLEEHFPGSKETRVAYQKFQDTEDAAEAASRTFCFQEYDIAKNKWTLLPLFDGAENFDFPFRLNHSSHVVIGKKLCISLGKSSFTFDTANRVWEDCILFGSNKRMPEEESVVTGGPPFDKFFKGRGIMCAGDILLGVGGRKNPAVAFKLSKGRVVNRKEFTLDLSTDAVFDIYPQIVDLGGGHFSLLHNVHNFVMYGTHSFSKHGVDSAMASVTFRLSRVENRQNNENDEFITCQVVEPKALLLRKVNKCSHSPLHAFSV